MKTTKTARTARTVTTPTEDAYLVALDEMSSGASVTVNIPVQLSPVQVFWLNGLARVKRQTVARVFADLVRLDDSNLLDASNDHSGRLESYWSANCK